MRNKKPCLRPLTLLRWLAMIYSVVATGAAAAHLPWDIESDVAWYQRLASDKPAAFSVFPAALNSARQTNSFRIIADEVKTATALSESWVVLGEININAGDSVLCFISGEGSLLKKGHLNGRPLVGRRAIAAGQYDLLTGHIFREAGAADVILADGLVDGTLYYITAWHGGRLKRMAAYQPFSATNAPLKETIALLKRIGC
ncbi:hypothetical protein [Intestinirhabdus alba]|jgi:hypothetical protein|uniref:Uncharacterized protein n=1 Tax=Intestinirhabdus alba TaxID=2899544 RepID=A0A6L6IIC5_9ENTR|nr:hypothetical protein [Intestinirhabdus alba]MTH46601.1 hypothetical protein [Intestinirhabdus alba]